MKNKKLTEREKSIYEFILSYRNLKGYSPTIREIQKGIFLNSPNMIHRYLYNMVEKGYLEITPKISRSIIIKEVTQ